MKFKLNTLQLITAGVFFTALIFLLLSYLVRFFYYPVFILVTVGFSLLSIIFIKNYFKQKILEEQKREANIMELALGEDGDKYVVQDAKQVKKKKRNEKWSNFDKLIPVILCLIIAIGSIILLIKSIISII